MYFGKKNKIVNSTKNSNPGALCGIAQLEFKIGVQVEIEKFEI